MKQNLIIRASAGTGKTFSLASRFIMLMLFQDVAPERILALTFSRAAAQEIYMKLLERLWKAAMSDEGASRERAVLCAGMNAEERARADAAAADWSRNRFAGILRRVIAVQHHGTIATLDSFILRIVRSFPLEMGFQNAVDVLDGFGEVRAIAESRAALLGREDEAADFIAAYGTATGGEFARTCAKVLGNALAGWRAFLLADRTRREAWTPASMRAALGVAANPEPPDLSQLPRSGKRNDPCEAFAGHVASFSPDGPIFPDNRSGKLAKFLFTHPDATDYTYETPSGRTMTVTCGAAGAEAVRAGVRYMRDLKFGHVIDVVAAKLALCRMIEAEYDASTRQRGLLTFSDFTDCQAVAEGDSDAALRLENLQFRFDSKFDHWALDEFQDTSALQWQCLRRLVKEAAQPGGGRTVMAVGDLKQSIYTWRGGDDGPFLEMMRWGEFQGENGEILPNAVSYRYEKNTADFINRVFGPENVRHGGVLDESCRPAVDRWLAEDCWMAHRPDVDGDGRPKAGDYVEVIAVPEPEDEPTGAPAADGDEENDGGAAMRILAPKVCALAADLWKGHEAAGSTDTVGILVRRNEEGAALAERLRALDVPVVWEGTDKVADSPVVKAVLQLLWLAEHPQDSFAWKVVNDLFPIRKTAFPGLTHQEKVSQEMSGMISRLGLSRALREIVGRICAAERRPDARSVIRLEGLVREAVSYEQRKDATSGVGSFIDYLETAAGRETSTSPHVVRILTIHRSKGLTFDHVIVPIPESGNRDSITRPRRGTPLVGEGWALSSIPEDEAKLDGRTAEAWRTAANERVLEQLRLNYVALTRARKSTHVLVCQDDHAGKIQFRDLLLKPFEGLAPQPACPYGNLVCAMGTMPAFGRKRARDAAAAPWNHAAGGPRVVRLSPSAAASEGGRGGRTRAAALFAAERSAAERGTAAHAAYAAIEWIDPAAPRGDVETRIASCGWREAFVRPSADAAVWRERSYEIFRTDRWETGQFDRVVFTGAGDARQAVIYDFKTNAKREDEDPEAFAERMQETYRGQMSAYREALALLTGLPPDRIVSKLLLLATGAVVQGLGL